MRVPEVTISDILIWLLIKTRKEIIYEEKDIFAGAGDLLRGGVGFWEYNGVFYGR